MALRYMRENLKSLKWVLWLVVGVFILLVFFEWGGFNDRAMGPQDGDAAATVGDKVITFSEFQQSYQRLENIYKQTLGDNYNRELLEQFNLPRQALDQLIQQKILLMEAERIGLKATDGEVQKAILDFPVFKDENGNFVGEERYRMFLRNNRLSVDDFESQMRESVLLTKLDDILRGTAYISDEELERTYREGAEKAKIRFVQLPATQFAEATASAEELQAFFSENQDDYALPEQRVLDYLLVDTAQLRRELEVPEEELQAYYDGNPEEFTRDEQVRARHILLKVSPTRPEAAAEAELQALKQRIEGGEDFAQLARDFSEDEGSAGRGGSLGYFGRNQMVKPFEDAAFGAPVGTVVGPVKSDFGFHLIEVQDRRDGGLQPFDQSKAVIRARLLGERSDELAAEKAQDLAALIEEKALNTVEALQQLAEEEGVTWATSEPFGENDNITGIGRAPDLTSAAFGLEQGGITEAVKVPRGWAIARLAEIREPRLPELFEVEQEVQRGADLEKRRQLAAERLEALRSEHEAAGDFDTLAAALEVEAQESGEFDRFGFISGLGPNQEVIQGALGMDEGAWGGPVNTDQGAVLYEVLERKTFDPAEFEEQKAELREQEEGTRMTEIQRSLIELRQRDLTPTYSPQVLDAFNIDGTSTGG